MNLQLWTISIVMLTVLYLGLDKLFLKIFKVQPARVTYDSAKTTLDRLSSWTTWITGLQTGAMAAMGLLITSVDNPSESLKRYAFFAILFFGSSIVLATWILGSLPSVQQGLVPTKENDPGVEKNDVYMAPLFSFVPLRLGRFTGIVHTYFLLGIVFLGLFVYELLTKGIAKLD